MTKTKTVLGLDSGRPIYQDGPAINPHTVVSGISGSGKSVWGISTSIQKADAGETILVINWRNVLDLSKVPPEIKKRYEQCRKVISVRSDGIAIPLFAPYKDKSGKPEDDRSLITRISLLLSGIIKNERGAQARCIREAIAGVLKEDRYRSEGIAAVESELENALVGPDKTAAKRAVSNLEPLFLNNVFRDGNFLEGTAKIYELDFEGVVLEYQNVIVEFLLSYLFQAGVQGAFEKRPLSIYIDECQNLNYNDRAPIVDLLNEGRKYNLSLLMIIQSRRLKIHSVLAQCATQVFFKPMDEDKSYLKRLYPGKERPFLFLLSRLKKGTFIIKVSYQESEEQALPIVLSTYLPPASTVNLEAAKERASSINSHAPSASSSKNRKHYIAVKPRGMRVLSQSPLQDPATSNQ